MRNAKQDRAIERRLSDRAQSLQAALLAAASERPRGKLTMKGLVRDSANVDTPQAAVDSIVQAIVAELKIEAAEAWARLELVASMVNDG